MIPCDCNVYRISKSFVYLQGRPVVIVVAFEEILVVVDVFVVTDKFVADDAVSEFVDDAF